MVAIVTREVGATAKGSPLTNAEVDNNFINLEEGKIESPASATDNAVVRFDGTTGKLVQNSVVTIADSTGDVAGVGALTMGGNLTLSGGTANGVLYLNGSKVATSGSALTFDGTTLANINSDGTGFSTQSAASNFSIMRLGTDSVNGYAFFQSGKSGTGTTLPFAWRQDSSELMRLTSTGLGIGVASPSVKLDVAGDIKMGTGLSSSQLLMAGSSYGQVVASGGTYYLDATTQIYRNSAGTTEYSRYTSAGNLLIGTTSAAVNQGVGLTLGSTSGATLSLSTSLAAGTTASPIRMDLSFRGYNNYEMARIRSWDESASTGWGYLTFATNNGSNTIVEAMRINNGQQVGIGTTLPGYRLEAYDSDSSGARQTPKDVVAISAYNPSNPYTGFGAGFVFRSSDYRSSTPRVQARIRNAITDDSVYTTGSGIAFDVTATEGAALSEVMNLSPSGVLGMGVTPNRGWYSTYAKAIQLGNVGMAVVGFTSSLSSTPYANLVNNAYYASDTNWKYFDGAKGVALYQQSWSEHRWFNAPTGTTDGTVTLTQAMTLDGNGFWKLGTTGYGANATIYGTNNAVGTTVGGSNQAMLLLVSSAPNTANYGPEIVFANTYSAPSTVVSASIAGTKTSASGSGSDQYNGNLVFKTSSYPSGLAQKMMLDYNGTLLINTTVTPANGGYLVVNSGISSSSTNVIELQQATNGANKAAAAFGVAIQNGGFSTNAADLTISTASGGSLSERARITSPGNVCIGTASDTIGLSSLTAKLVVQPASVSANQIAWAAKFQQGSYADNAITALGFSVEASYTRAAFGYVRGTAGYDVGSFAWYLASNSSAGTTVAYTDEKMRLDYNGNLLLGTTSGSNRLTVSSTANDYISRMYNTNATGADMLYLQSTADPNNSTYKFIYTYSGSTARFFVQSNGGIGNYQANNTNLSDRREKTNFAPAGEYLSKICAIPVQTFNYIDQNLEEDAGLTLGVVAQDVQAVAPELVMESNWGTKEEPKIRLSIYQTDLQYALMKALQELKAEFDAYKASHP